MGEWPPAHMMINADKEMIFQSCQARTLNTVAFQDDRGFVLTVYSVGLYNFVSKRKAAIDPRNAIMQNYLGFLAE